MSRSPAPRLPPVLPGLPVPAGTRRAAIPSSSPGEPDAGAHRVPAPGGSFSPLQTRACLWRGLPSSQKQTDLPPCFRSCPVPPDDELPTWPSLEVPF